MLLKYHLGQKVSPGEGQRGVYNQIGIRHVQLSHFDCDLEYNLRAF